MGKYSDDPAIDAAVLDAEAAFDQARDAAQTDPSDETWQAYKEAKQAFTTARTTARGNRPGLTVSAEG